MDITPLNNNKVYGHEEAKKLFLDAFNSKRLHHSWLISGEKGIGKATLTYHFAKFLLQHPFYQPHSLEIINHNHIIKKIEAQSHPDLIVINAEVKDNELRKQPNITIEEVREVIQFLRLTPSESSYRVVVIDGVEHMNVNAANALLKILEEPPQNAFIFLITSSPFKILPTIRSRCISVKLKALSLPEFNAALSQFNSSISLEAAEEIYKITNGNVRLAIDINNNLGINYISQIEQSLKSSATSNIIKFIEGIKTDQENWGLLKYIIVKFLINKIKLSLSNSSIDLEKKLDYFFELQRKLAEMEVFHLDKQHFLLATLSELDEK